MRRFLDILVLADLHAAYPGGMGRVTPDAAPYLGAPLLIRKAVNRLRHEGVDIGLIIVLGDLVEEGGAPAAEATLAELAAELKKPGAPVLAVPGNHDGDPARMARLCDSPPGLHAIGGYGFLVFHDAWGEGDACTRSVAGLALPAAVAAARPDLPLVALQHNPLHPPIEDAYPYIPLNGEAIRAGYRDARLLLSLSGHYHAGQAAHALDGVAYCTAPALCETPFRFAHVRLRDREVKVTFHALRTDVAGLVDVHCHTEYAYCRSSVAADLDIGISRALGLSGVCLTEHAFQLYFPNDEAWSWRWQSDPGLLAKARREGGGRMPEYRRFAFARRGEFVRLGLEVDLCTNGRLLLAEEDREGWDFLVGAIHSIPELPWDKPTQSEAERLFMRDAERLLRHPIAVLAHPFRFFSRSSLIQPTHLYRPVARLLAAAGVAAEVNCHVYRTDAAFVAECLAQGVKIALATDAHDLVEVGELAPHLAVLRAAGARNEDLPRVLFRPA